MAKFYGAIGYAITEEVKKGVFKNNEVIINYPGDVLNTTARMQNSGQVNDNIIVANKISILADPFAYNNFHNMKYIEYLGTKWKITSVEVQYPRLILNIGEVYNG